MTSDGEFDAAVICPNEFRVAAHIAAWRNPDGDRARFMCSIFILIQERA